MRKEAVDLLGAFVLAHPKLMDSCFDELTARIIVSIEQQPFYLISHAQHTDNFSLHITI